MSSRYFGLGMVVVVAAAIITYKVATGRSSLVAAPAKLPAVLLVADLSEAESKCGCGEIIRAVRGAAENGIAVSEFTPDSKSELLKRYRVMTAPTVLILDRDGEVVSRYEGEEARTIDQLRAALAQLVTAHQ